MPQFTLSDLDQKGIIQFLDGKGRATSSFVPTPWGPLYIVRHSRRGTIHYASVGRADSKYLLGIHFDTPEELFEILSWLPDLFVLYKCRHVWANGKPKETVGM